jgi:hypothetical protein
MDIMVRIKRAVLAGRFRFTRKATEERERDHLSEQEVREAILSANSIYKSIRSVNPVAKNKRELLHIIYGTTFTGTAVYTKGKIVVEGGVETYYILISAKRSAD